MKLPKQSRYRAKELKIKKIDIIIFDRESPQKCSIHPLKKREDFLFIHSDKILHHQVPPETFQGYILLHVDGPKLTIADADRPLLLVDASWRRASKICTYPELACLEKRSLVDIATYYPRKSRFYSMPSNGLASIEALYIAFLMQGRKDPTLLDNYHWKNEFLSQFQQGGEA